MKIIVDQPIETMPLDKQEEIFVLSRTNEVFCRDVNGELWQVLDMTTGDEESDKLAVQV